MGYRGAIADGSAVVMDDRDDSVVTGRAAKETLRDNPPGFGDCTTRSGVGVVGAVTETRGSVDRGLG